MVPAAPWTAVADFATEMLDLPGRLLSAPFFNCPIVVVGTGRSGTSVLLQALGHHPHIYALPGEAPFLTSIGGSAQLFDGADNSGYYRDSVRVPLSYLYERLRRLGFEVATGPNFGTARLLKGLVGLAPSPLGRRHWAAKSFPSERVTAGLVTLYPRIRFLYIVRSGLDVVQSRTRFKGFSHQDFRQHCVNWAEGVDKYRHLTRLDRCHCTTQEALLADPETFFSGILQFLALPQHPGPAAFARSNLVHPLDESTRTGTDPRKALAEREPPFAGWSAEQKAAFKEICGPGMAELGYEVPF